MTQPSARVIADSINAAGNRITTLEVVMHRFVLAEFNTHRMFSRNSASSRAIPARIIQEKVNNALACPVYWGKEQKGMQSGAEFTEFEIPVLREDWRNASVEALNAAELLTRSGVHKSLTNRLLEPFMWHTVIVTATEWDNFFHQRCSEAAQPEMKAAADAMQIAYYQSTPVEMAHGAWHLPYTHSADRAILRDRLEANAKGASVPELGITNLLKNISVARCARVSYLTHDGVRDLSMDLELFDKLMNSGHWSPFEHVATPVVGEPYQQTHHYSDDTKVVVYRDCGNFRGWKQFRKEFHTENFEKFVPNLPELAQQRMRIEAGLTPWTGKGENQ